MTDKVKQTVKQKREAHIMTIQRNALEQVQDWWKREYMECERKVKGTS